MVITYVIGSGERDDFVLWHKMADFQPRTILTTAMSILEVGWMQQFSECSAMTEE